MLRGVPWTYWWVRRSGLPDSSRWAARGGCWVVVARCAHLAGQRWILPVRRWMVPVSQCRVPSLRHLGDPITDDHGLLGVQPVNGGIGA